MSLLFQLLTVFVFPYGTQSENILCDGTITNCAGQTLTCTDNEACSIQCTGGTGGCIGATFNCPANGDCTVECLSGVGTAGCAAVTIHAFDSLSLTIDNTADNVRDAFFNSSIYCPFEGTCSLLSGGQNRVPFANVDLYSIFGFALNQVSVTCTNGDACKRQISMHCLDDYASSCTMDPITGSNCDATSSSTLCDTVFNTISGVWTDDYSLDLATGWIVRDWNGSFIASSTYNGSLATYHGPFYGDSNSDPADIEVNSMLRYFYCAAASTVDIEYYFSYSCAEDTDFSSLSINGVSVANKFAATAASGVGESFLDPNLESYVNSRCPDAWRRKKVNGTSAAVAAGEVVKVQIDIGMNFVNEASFINALQITCVPVTAAPTTAAPTQPTVATPTTATPTTQMPTTARPTADPTLPTSDPTTAQPTADTAAPTQQPTAPTESPTQPRTGRTPFTANNEQEVESLQSTDVNTDALWIAILLIVGACILGVIAACVVWRKHEKEYGPIFQQRKEDMMKIREYMLNNTSQDSAGNGTGSPPDEQMQDGLEMTTRN